MQMMTPHPILQRRDEREDVEKHLVQKCSKMVRILPK
jgi:hypothetical protein